MKAYYCEKCHNRKQGKNLKEVAKELNEILDMEVEFKCTSYCGPGKSQFFIEIDEIVYEDENYDELIKKIKEENGN